MSPFSPTTGIILYAFGFVFHLLMLIFMIYQGEYVSSLVIFLIMLGFLWGYSDCINWSKKWSEDE